MTDLERRKSLVAEWEAYQRIGFGGPYDDSILEDLKFDAYVLDANMTGWIGHLVARVRLPADVLRPDVELERRIRARATTHPEGETLLDCVSRLNALIQLAAEVQVAEKLIGQ